MSPFKIAGVGGGRTPEFIEMVQITSTCTTATGVLPQGLPDHEH